MRETETPTSAEVVASKRPIRAKIRLATRADAAELQAIYSYYVENTTISFEYEAPSVAEMERRIAEVEGVYPFYVCVVDGETGEDAGTLSADDRDIDAKIDENGKTDKPGERIVGYALAHRAFERAAYSWVAETAVYVDRNWRRRGIGEALYSALIATLEAQGVRTLYAVVVAENKASVEFHRRAGYQDFATFKNSGWKFDRWLDVVWLERSLGVWRDEGDKSRNGNALESDGKTSKTPPTNPAPSPIRPLAEMEEPRFGNFLLDKNTPDGTIDLTRF